MAEADTSGTTRGLIERVMSAFNGDPQNQEQLIELLKTFTLISCLVPMSCI